MKAEIEKPFWVRKHKNGYQDQSPWPFLKNDSIGWIKPSTLAVFPGICHFHGIFHS